MNRIEQALRAAVIDAWTKGTSATQHALAQAVTHLGAKAKAPFSVSQRQVGIYFTKWAEAGITTDQVGSNGHAGAAYAFNWTGRLLGSCSLLDAARPALVHENGVPRRDPDGNKLRTALRMALGVEEHGRDRDLLEACATVPATELHALPQRAYDAAVAAPRRAGEDGVGKRTAANYRATLRAFLRDAALNGRVPVVLPRVWASDCWEEARDRFFGAPVGRLSQTKRTLRTYWVHFVAGVKALEPPPLSFDDVTLQMVEAVCRELGDRGENQMRQHVKWMLRRIAREHGVGPYARHVGGRRTRNGWLNEDRLMGPNGEAASDGDWGAFLDMAGHAGFGPAWRDHLAWYGDFITLPEHQVEASAVRFPTRPANWDLDATSLVKRVINLRTILYHAPRLLGQSATTVSLYDVFGGDGARIVLAGLEQRWQERYRAGQVSSPNADSLEKLVIAFGLLARSLELRIQHARARGRGRALRVLGPGVPVEQQQTAYAEAYRSASEKAKKIKVARGKEPSGHGENSVRSVARIVKNTPAWYWIGLLDEAKRRVQSYLVHDRNGVRTAQVRDDVPLKPFHTLVFDTFYLGWLISTGMRIEETVHIRLDIQYTEELRALREPHARVIDRKETPNTLPHEYKLRERYVPLWLEQLYLESARPWFMTVYPQIERRTNGGRVLKKGRPVQSHPFLFVTVFGEPYGCLEEAADGTGRDKLALKARKNELRDRFKRFCGRLGHELAQGDPKPSESKWRVPALPREYSNHVVRIAMGYEIAQKAGSTAAANYLGDQEASIIGRYQGVKGKYVDAGVVAPEDFEDWVPPSVRMRREREAVPTQEVPAGAGPRKRGAATAPPVPAAPPTVPAAAPGLSMADRLDVEMAKLEALRDAGRISPAQFAKLADAVVSRLAEAA